MSTTKMDTEFARAVRAEITAIGGKTSRLQRHQRRARALTLSIGAVALVGATTGAAVIVNNLPGTTTVSPLGTIVAATHTGTASIDLGPAPANAAVVVIDLKCVSDSGQLSVALDRKGTSGADRMGADCALARHTIHITDGLLPAPGTSAITITATPGTSWKATAQYATSATTAWGVNAQGQSYGVPNGNGLPDLEAAQATNGRQGYVFTKELMTMERDTYINVYESDGTTVIGKFTILSAPDIPVDVSKIPASPEGVDK